MRDSEVCLHCGQQVRRLIVGGTVRQRIVDVIASRPDGIDRESLIRIVYACDPNGGPDTPNTVSVIVHHANRVLRQQGYEITSAKGRGARYRLVQTKPVAEVRKRYRRFAHGVW
jgi:hypothetical protein